MQASVFANRFPTLEPKLRQIAGKYANDAHDAEDIFQHLCEKILTRDISKDESTDTQIYHLANWYAIDYLRGAKVYTTYVMGESDLPGNPDGEDVEDSFEYYLSESESLTLSGPEAEIIHDEELAGILTALRSLSGTSQKIVKMLADGHNHKEIAKELHVSQPRVTQQIKNIQIRLTEMNITL